MLEWGLSGVPVCLGDSGRIEVNPASSFPGVLPRPRRIASEMCHYLHRQILLGKEWDSGGFCTRVLAGGAWRGGGPSLTDPYLNLCSSESTQKVEGSQICFFFRFLSDRGKRHRRGAE